MMFCSNDSPPFHAGEKIVSLVIHPPEIRNGTGATIISQQIGMLYAVQLPSGELHEWLAWFELSPVNPNEQQHKNYSLGDYARVVNDTGHHMIQKGMTVRIVKAIATPFYALRLDNGSYHRWLAEFEIAHPL